MTETPTEPQESSPPAPRPRGRQTVGDMVRSMSLVLVVVAVVVLLTLRDDPTQTIHRVDFTEQLQSAREVAPYDVAAPVGLGDRWKATSARSDNARGVVTWHLGLVTPAEHYAAVEQSNGPMTAFVDSFVAGATKSGFRDDLRSAVATARRRAARRPCAGAARERRHDDGDRRCHVRRAPDSRERVARRLTTVPRTSAERRLCLSRCGRPDGGATRRLLPDCPASLPL